MHLKMGLQKLQHNQSIFHYIACLKSFCFFKVMVENSATRLVIAQDLICFILAIAMYHMDNLILRV